MYNLGLIATTLGRFTFVLVYYDSQDGIIVLNFVVAGSGVLLAALGVSLPNGVCDTVVQPCVRFSECIVFMLSQQVWKITSKRKRFKII